MAPLAWGLQVSGQTLVHMAVQRMTLRWAGCRLDQDAFTALMTLLTIYIGYAMAVLAMEAIHGSFTNPARSGRVAQPLGFVPERARLLPRLQCARHRRDDATG